MPDRTRSRMLSITLAIGALGAGIGCGPAPGSGPPERIILIVADMLRRDHVGAYGGPATPNMDALAARGQTFTQAVSSFHQTTMSMGALFTGRTPSLEATTRKLSLPWNAETWCGMRRFRETEATDDACIPAGLTTLAGALRGRGYRTLGIVSNELIFRPMGYDHGFDRWVEVDQRNASPPAQRPLHELESPAQIIARLRNGQRVNRAAATALEGFEEGRLFLYLHYMDVHDYRFRRVPYAEAVEAFDHALGEMIAHLERRGLLRDAVVLLVSDHGELLDETFTPASGKHFGNPSFEPVLRVPLIVSPARFEDTDRLVRTQDLRGMIVTLAGGPEPEPKDLLPGELMISEMFWQTYRKGRWKSMWSRGTADHHLFDLEADPGEQHDVASQHADVIERHRARIDELTRDLAANPLEERDLTEEEIRRLRVLGYLEE